MGIKISKFTEGLKDTPKTSGAKAAGAADKTPSPQVPGAKTQQTPTAKNSEDALQTASFGKGAETFPKSKYNSADWYDVNPSANKVLGFKTGGYTYTTADGTKIKADNIDNVIVKQNAKTGEIVIAGLNDGVISGGSKDTKLTVYDSILDKISLNSGNDFLEIFNSEIEKVETGKGHDEINVSNSKVKDIDAGKGNDKINLENSTSEGTIKGGDGDDYIQADKSNIFLVKGDDGKDNIFLNNSTAGEIYGGADDDTLVINNTTGAEKLDAGKGNDIINVSNSEINTIDGAKGTDNIITDNSKIGDIKTDKNDVINSAKNNNNVNSAEISSIQTLDEDTQNEAINITKMKTSGYNHELTPEEEMQAVTVDFFENNLNSMKTQFEEQEKEDGSISDAYNWVKQLTDLGVAKDDINSAIKEQEKMVKEMKDAINGDGDKSFEEVFKDWTGVEYNEDNVSEYLETSQIYSLAVSGLVKTENFKTAVSKASSLGEVSELYTNYYGSEELGREKLNEFLKDSFMENAQEFGYPSSVEINENNELVITRPKEWGAMGPVDGTEYETTVEDISEVTNMINTMGRCFNLDKYTDEYTDKIEKTIGCSLEELQNEYASKQLKSFGKGNSFQKLIDRYCAEQDGFADKLGSITQKCGLGMMAAGGIICLAFPAAAGAGVAMMNTGKWTAIGGMFGDNAIELADNLMSENGLSKDEALGLAKESITELALLYSGGKINGVSMGVKGEVLNATQSKALAFASQIGTDATLSLLTDLVITGEVNLTGEGISQLMGIITGLAGARVNSYTKESFDAADELFKNNDIDGAKSYLKEKGFTDAQIDSHFKQFNAGANDAAIGTSAKDIQTDTPRQQMTELTGADKEIADRLKWDDTQRSQYLDLLNQGLKSKDAQWFILDKLQSDSAFDFVKYTKAGLDGESVASGMKAGWNSEQFELGAKLNDAGMYSKDVVECINKGWDAAKCDKYIKLSSEGIDEYFLKDGLDAGWTDKHWESYQKLSGYVDNKYALDDMQYKFDMKWSADDFSNFVTLVTSGIDADMASKGVKADWSAEHWNTYNDLMNYSGDKLTLKRIMDKADFKWSADEFSSYANLIKSGENIFDASAKISGTTKPKTEYKLSIDPNTGKQNLDAEMFFVNVQGYGRDTDWGTKMAKATEDTSELVSMGAEYTEVVSFFINETKQIQSDAANPAKNQTGRTDGAMMSNYGLLKKPGERLQTPLDSGRYSYFIDKLAAAGDMQDGSIVYNKTSAEFPLATTTKVDLNFENGSANLWHPAGEANLKYAESVYNDLIKMDNPSADTVIDSVAKMHWLLAQNAPFQRGSDSISSGLSKAIFRSYGIEVSPLKEGVSVDFEAFSMNMEDFVKNYRSFYVSEPKKIN